MATELPAGTGAACAGATVGTASPLGWRVAAETTVAEASLQRQAGRWHYAGAVVLYCSTTPELALLEARVHHRIGTGRYSLQRVASTLPLDAAAVRRIDLGELPADWTGRKSLTRRIGTTWLAERRFALLSVPSSICPESHNLLINPELLPTLVIACLRPCRLDRRLLICRR
jgi:RES domain-containing protein